MLNFSGRRIFSGDRGQNRMCEGDTRKIYCVYVQKAEKMLTVMCTIQDSVLSLLLVIFTSTYVLTYILLLRTG